VSITKLIRFSGLALMLGGILFAAHEITHPPGETAKYALYSLWVPSHVLGGIACVLISLGVVGMYARQSEKVGVLGLISFILTFVGLTLTAGALIFLSAVIIPFLAARGIDPFVDPKGPLMGSPVVQLTAGLTALSLSLGILLFAIVTLRARVLPRLGSWMVILLIPFAVVAVVFVFFIAGGTQPGVLEPLLGSWLGFALVAWGWALWSEKAEIVAQAQPAR
jgi:hypothetical protein